MITHNPLEFKNKDKSQIQEELTTVLKKASDLIEDMNQDMKYLRLDQEEVIKNYREIEGQFRDCFEKLEHEKDIVNVAVMEDLAEQFSQYQRSQEFFEESRNKAIYQMKTGVGEAADRALSKVRALENIDNIGEKIVLSKKGLVRLFEFTDNLSKTTKVKDIEEDISSISTICEFDANVDISSLSENDKSDLLDTVRSVQRSLNDLADELGKANALFSEIEAVDYSELEMHFYRIKKKVLDTEYELDGLKRRI